MDVPRRHHYLCAMQFSSCQENKFGLELRQLAVSCERLAWRESRSKYSTTSSLKKAVFPKQALSPCFVFTPFAKDGTKDASPGLCPCRRCIRVLWTSMLCDYVWLELAWGWLPWALALGGDHSVMSRTGKRRISTGWIAVSLGDRLHCGLESLTVGWCRHDQKPPLWPPQGWSSQLTDSEAGLEHCKACLHFCWQPACARGQWEWFLIHQR